MLKSIKIDSRLNGGEMKNRFSLTVRVLSTILIAGSFIATGYPSKKTESAKDWNIAQFDAARNAGYLSAVEKDVVLELNKVCSDPQKYVKMYIKPRLAYFDGNYNGRAYSEPGKTTILTNEGKKAVEECYNVLNGMKNDAPALTPSRGISSAAKSHVQEQGKKGTIGHNRADGSDFAAVMNRYGRWGGGCAENISYGAGDGREIVIQLLVDDGTPSRGHRKNIMNPSYRVVGVAAGSHAKYGQMCVMDFAQSYTEK